MKANRRSFLRNSMLGAGMLGALPLRAAAPAASKPRTASFLTRTPSMKLGMVTYQLGQYGD